MKISKKILVLFVAIAMIFTSAMSVSADDTGSITIENAAKGANYDLYKIFDLTYDDSTPPHVAYTYKKVGTTDAFLTALQGTGSPFTLVESETADVYNVTTTADAETIRDWLTTNVTDAQKLTALSVQNNANATITFSGLDLGYYLIKTDYGNSLATLDSTLPNVTVKEKNFVPSWDNDDGDPTGETPGNGKLITAVKRGDANDGEIATNKLTASAGFGDVVTYDLGINAPSTTAVEDPNSTTTPKKTKVEYVTNYYFTDTIATGLTYVADSFNVYYTDPYSSTPDTKHPLTASTNSGADKGYVLTITGNTFEIAIPWATVVADTTNTTEVKTITPLHNPLVKLHVEYKATVTNAALIGGAGNKNKANFTYDTLDVGDTVPTTPVDSDPTFPTTGEKSTTVYTYALGVQKVDETGTKLAGAKFHIDDIAVTGSAGVYEYNGKATAGADLDTDANGQIIIKGVPTVTGGYKIKEIKAPQGYNAVPETFTVTPSITSEVTTKTVTIDAEDLPSSTESKTFTFTENILGIGVVNVAGLEMPATGGIGTTIFYVAGGILLVGAAIMLVTRKRMSE